jgi:hypothetical protein
MAAETDRVVTRPGDSERLAFYWESPSTLGECRAALRRAILQCEEAREGWAHRESILCSTNGRLQNEIDRLRGEIAKQSVPKG